LYIPISNRHSSIIIHKSSINNPQGGGADISLFSGEKSLGQKETFVKYKQSQE
jgi:hypothetical protein